MGGENIDEILKNAICEKSRVDMRPEDIKEDTNFIDDLGFDSLEMIGMLIMIEEALNIEFIGDELILDEFRDYEHLYELAKRKLKME